MPPLQSTPPPPPAPALRVETEAGWRIVWDPFEDPAKARAREASTANAPQVSRMLSFGAGSLAAGTSHAQRLMRKSVDFLSSHLPFRWGGDASTLRRQLQQRQNDEGGSGMGAPQAAAPGGPQALDLRAATAGMASLVPGGGSDAVRVGFWPGNVGMHAVVMPKRRLDALPARVLPPLWRGRWGGLCGGHGPGGVCVASSDQVHPSRLFYLPVCMPLCATTTASATCSHTFM